MLLEVIVQTVEDAVASEAGGADRLEVVRDLACGGLTPPIALVREIAGATRLPLRVMLRHHDTFTIDSDHERLDLQRTCAALADLGVDGIVAGFARGGALDVETLSDVLAAAPSMAATCHRAFDSVTDWREALRRLDAVPQVDRVLTSGGAGSWEGRHRRLVEYAAVAGSRVTILAGGGIDDDAVRDLARGGQLREVHVGRAARASADPDAPVSAAKVRRLRLLADGADGL